MNLIMNLAVGTAIGTVLILLFRLGMKDAAAGMKLPFVSRARLDMALHNLDEMRKLAHAADERGKSWEALFTAEVLKRDALVEKLLQMKQQGFTTATQRQAEPAKEPSRIEATIAERAGTNSALRRHLTRWATQRQELRVPEDEIVDALSQWNDPDEVEA